MPVHLYGQVADMLSRSWTGAHHGLKVIEERPRRSVPRMRSASAPAASATSVACRSSRRKNLGAFGDAGCASPTTPRSPSAWQILRVHGGKPKYYHALIGGNFRIDEMQAAVLNVKLPHLDSWTDGRQRNAAFYDGAFARAKPGEAVQTPAGDRRAAGTSTTST